MMFYIETQNWYVKTVRKTSNDLSFVKGQSKAQLRYFILSDAAFLGPKRFLHLWIQRKRSHGCKQSEGCYLVLKRHDFRDWKYLTEK